MFEPIDRRVFTAGMASLLAGTSRGAGSLFSTTAVGPMVGHVSPTSALLWFRPAQTGKFTLLVNESGQEATIELEASTEAQRDDCLTWQIDGLKAETKYEYSIQFEGEALTIGDACHFSTAPVASNSGKICLAFGSCAPRTPLALWTQMEEHNAQGLILLGDTPYIDSTVLATVRQKHRDFLAVPELAKLIRHTPVWGTWDDHDFGRNDSDGTLPGKENSRQAFHEYRANASCGEDGQGIYTKFRYGPVEVFLLDTRWFARTEQSPVDSEKPTLLGARQWDWLRNSLKDSSATFKVIACGMIWDDKKNGESDDWGTYEHERSALFDFLGTEEITGVVLIGGDIHCSRLLRYKTEQQVGYPIHQMIVSPIHSSTISSLNVAHPDLIRGEPIPHVWLKLEVDATQESASLHAEWIQMEGREMWDLTLTEDQLRRS